MSRSIIFDVQSNLTTMDGLINQARAKLGGAKLNGFVAQALRDGGKLAGKEIPGIAAHITRTAPSMHKTAQRLGASPSNFYALAAQGIELVVTDASGGIIIVNGAPIFARWQKSVVIRPRAPHQWLTVPACKEAYNKRAGEFGNRLEFQPRGPKLGILTWRTEGSSRPSEGEPEPEGPQKPKKARKARRAATSRKPGQQVEVVFWCVKEVTLPQETRLLPPMEDILRLAKVGAYRAMQQAREEWRKSKQQSKA